MWRYSGINKLISDKAKEDIEVAEEEAIAKEGEIMELANPEEENEEEEKVTEEA